MKSDSEEKLFENIYFVCDCSPLNILPRKLNEIAETHVRLHEKQCETKLREKQQ